MIAKQEFVASLKSVSNNLEECAKCLEGERFGKEGRTAAMGKKMKAEIGEMIAFADFI